MTYALYTAAFLLIATGIVHSYLGERYILIRLFRRDNLPKLFGGTEFTTRTLRFVWHLLTVAWFGFAAIIIFMVHPPVNIHTIALIIGYVFIAHGIIALVVSHGKHLSWLVFLTVGIIIILAAYR